MSFNSRHISKAGARIMEQLAHPTPGVARKRELEALRAVPSFLRPDLPRVMDPAKRYRTPQEWLFMPGDRVVIMRGPCRGNIAVVREHDRNTNGYLLDESGPQRTVVVPREFWQEGQESHVVAMPQALRRQDLRLVAEIESPQDDGKLRTVAVDNVMFEGEYYDKWYRRKMPYRCVFGQRDLVIPWPRPEPQETGTLGTDPGVAREQSFWVDSLVRGPIPSAALATVRNPHSKYRRGKLTPRDIKRLVAPEMPAMPAMRQRKNSSQHKKQMITDEDIELIGSRVQQFLESQTTTTPK
ncbi:mitochondrial 54S ribosomal protein uL24m MRPL40 KNAG_0J01920 [Huiozyma naganishii CBS 8797]|uniref:KOW domain-containing protein n=1 Tax=Huiozyma naganishii (strain ATCC MYA-139 / BCRC 22969 / CBS 8797 / KCTC 17520 / NBRC 10181 / NCYC 3082 / Yp74L-3) TaxID=1071383 RepID=J7RR11_HUIN7|nr:hypothetical protein KNAG_0J01920 [Kazachstania naganishii CBS 8797]CCK72273.1 hypothetical protein KNAG_0J01920 [Kazachstania naganishii CBS 8797]